MNEQYLFRGKRLDNGEWVEGCAYTTDTDAFIITDLSTYPDGFMQAYGEAVDPATVGQCTGLRDRTGKLIFEGDIIRDIFKADDIYIGNAAWNRRSLSWCARRRGTVGHMPLIEFTAEDNITCKTAEIIGSIYDTPELLKEV